MRRNIRCHMVLSLLLIFVCFTPTVQAGEMTISGPEQPALVLSGSSITRGRGFLHNFIALSPSEMEDIAASASGEATYRLGLGDCFTEAVVYSTYEDHGTPAWIFRRVYGLDLRVMAEALGIDTDQVMSITASAEDGMIKTLSDAFGIKAGRWSYDFNGTRVNPVAPVLALYETTTETQEPAEGVMPELPALGPDSPDRVDNVFGYGQTDFREINSCYWVKNVRRLRFGTEIPALTICYADGSEADMSLSTLISRGSWQLVAGQVRAQGVPVSHFLEEFGIDVPVGYTLRAQSPDSSVDLAADQLTGAFIAWQATDNGSSVKNATPLRLYCSEGEVLPDLSVLSIIPSVADVVPPVIGSDFTDLDNYGWARDAIADLAQLGVVKGLSTDSYGPGLNIKRGDFMLMLARAYSLKADSGENFRDVPVGSYYYDAIAASRILGIARGDGELFYPESTITRQEAFTLLQRTLSLVGHDLPAGGSALSSFSDSELTANWAREPIASLVNAGLVRGSNNVVNPLGMLTRAEMAVILKRALDMR